LRRAMALNLDRQAFVVPPPVTGTTVPRSSAPAPLRAVAE
jgi:hypothetical protein